MTTFLADGDLLIALTVTDHVHHGVTTDWFEDEGPQLATCPITEGTLLRFLMREGCSALDAAGLLESMRGLDWHTFWPDQISYATVRWGGVIGHRQVTDAYLVALAQHHNGRVASLDRGLAALHGDVVQLLSP